jgi:hypothetical protein
MVTIFPTGIQKEGTPARLRYDTASDFQLISRSFVERTRLSGVQVIEVPVIVEVGGKNKVVLNEQISLSWAPKNHSRRWETIFYLVPDDSFDILFGRHFIYENNLLRPPREPVPMDKEKKTVFMFLRPCKLATVASVKPKNKC